MDKIGFVMQMVISAFFVAAMDNSSKTLKKVALTSQGRHGEFPKPNLPPPWLWCDTELSVKVPEVIVSLCEQYRSEVFNRKVNVTLFYDAAYKETELWNGMIVADIIDFSSPYYKKLFNLELIPSGDLERDEKSFSFNGHLDYPTITLHNNLHRCLFHYIAEEDTYFRILSCLIRKPLNASCCSNLLHACSLAEKTADKLPMKSFDEILKCATINASDASVQATQQMLKQVAKEKYLQLPWRWRRLPQVKLNNVSSTSVEMQNVFNMDSSGLELLVKSAYRGDE